MILELPVPQRYGAHDESEGPVVARVEDLQQLGIGVGAKDEITLVHQERDLASVDGAKQGRAG